MSHEEHRRVSLPSRLSDAAPAAALYARSEQFEAASRPQPALAPHRGSTFEWMGRALRRHWWQILPLWLITSGLIWWFLPRWLPNTYEAHSEVQIEAGDQGPRGDKPTETDFLTFKETQVRRIVSPRTIDAALVNDPNLARNLVTADQPSPQVAIRTGLDAVLEPRTHLIRVSMTAVRDDALNRIVDGVIQAYLDGATEFYQEGKTQLRYKLRQLMQGKADQVKQKRDAIEALVRQNGTLDPEQGKNRHTAAIEQHTNLTRQLQAIELDVVNEQARLAQVKQDEAAQAARPKPQPEVVTRDRATKAFYLTPEVAALKAQQDEAKRKLVLAEREPGKAGEVNRATLQGRVKELQEKINELWGRLEPVLMIAAAAEKPSEPGILESSRIEANLTGLKARQALLATQLDAVKQETLTGGTDVLKLEFLRQDLDRAETVLKSMTQSFHDAEVVSGQPIARFQKEFAATTVEQSAARSRWLVGVVGPALTLLGLLGFFGLVEKRAGRILDPSDLSSKARLHVIGLVPPLPRSRPARLSLSAGKPQRSQVDLERFIQSLDQLRVLVCGRGDGQGRNRRSLLITSASENEGKSTLAAQLAERSVNAGLLTLLIDADLRNPTLSRMFDRPDSVGLANVLRGELLAEEAISTVTEAGGFHFLPAGQVHDDLSRLLASDRLARLLESARESFDLVLVDSPPVLPVADALTIGQWVDGAVLTVRHKTSRLPLVERAAQQLTSVGVPIIGAVVSGMKDRYATYYGPKPATDSDRAATVDSVL